MIGVTGAGDEMGARSLLIGKASFVGNYQLVSRNARKCMGEVPNQQLNLRNAVGYGDLNIYF